MKLARGTSPWLWASWGAAVALALAAAVAFTKGSVGAIEWLLAVLAVVLVAWSLVMLNFFRDPERVVGEGIVASADGVVTLVEETEDGGHRVVTFMNPLNVHVNRAPISGVIVKVEHVAGGFIPAWEKDAEVNERVVWDLDTEIGPVRVVQIAGALARRIVPYLDAGEKVMKGERIGIIRLGSRVDVYLPPGPVVRVRVGEKVTAGVTPIATIP